MVDRSEEVLDVGVKDVIAALGRLFPQRFQRIGRASARPEAVRARTKIRLEDRLHDQLRRHLNHSVSDRRDAQWSLFSIGLRDVLPLDHRRPVRPIAQLDVQFFQEILRTSLFDLSESLTIDPRCAPVAPHSFPCLPQDVTPVDAVV